MSTPELPPGCRVGRTLGEALAAIDAQTRTAAWVEATPAEWSTWDEAAFQARVVGLAHARGWLCYHTFDSRRSEEGFPDLVLIELAGPGVRARGLAWELKVPPNKPSAKQLEWLAAFARTGYDARVLYPDQWPEIARVLTLKG